MAAAFLQPACATSPMPTTCTVTGATGALPGMDAAAICERFESDLAAALGQRPAPEGLAIALTLHKRGAIDAQLSAGGTGARPQYPSISVESTDRALQPDDIDRLARAVAAVLAEPPTDQTAQPTAPHKGE
ncbi:MAG: hypothetical protein RSE14_07030 [Erythrobacter sp.]|uniref:hypothetical protein n=1 Tax=Erythrobacter sp. TaxID=1042 RepID=UPI002B49AE6B|nr:hypothetical protein [Erythrobacter sp.]WRH71830.1 MAG: hypothetical protein RSE14_07030 [Erythrobacter sp.]